MTLDHMMHQDVREPPEEAEAVGAGESSMDWVHKRVREAILANELEPGSIISQVRLAKTVGVSRTPLREALRLLQMEGLVEAEHNRRVRISSLSLEDLEELYALRISTESLAIRLAVPQMIPSDLDVLREHLAEMTARQQERDVDRWEVVHREFHRNLIQGAGCRCTRMFDEHSRQSERYRRAFISQEPRAWAAGEAEHAAIVEACAKKDASAAASLLARHLGRTALILLMSRAPEHEPAMIRTAIRSVVGPEKQ